MIRTLLAAGVSIAALAACSSGAGSGPDTPSGAPQTAVSQGQELYDRYCKLCHGEQGEGYASDNANALTNRTFLATASDAFLMRAIVAGRPGTPMSAFGKERGGPLTHEQIRQIVIYLRGLEPVPPVEVEGELVQGDPEAARPTYQQRCAECHGERGGGKTALSLNNPTFLATASDGFIRYAIEHGRPGTPMPAFGETLSEQQIDDLTRLIRSWARTVPKSNDVGELPPRPDQVVINPDGPAPDFPRLREGRYVPAEAVRDALDKGARMVLLDARPTSDWLKSHIPGALPVPYYDGIDAIVKALPRDGTWIVAYCGCPHAASGQVMDLLRDAGFGKTAVIDEGIFVWAERGYPLTFGATSPAREPQR